MGVRITDRFSVEPGAQALRVITKEFALKNHLVMGYGRTSDIGYGLTLEALDRFGGKKLKLYHVVPVAVEGKTFGDKPGRKFHFYMSQDKTDSFLWNEYMFQEWWDAGNSIDGKTVDAAKPVAEKPAVKLPPKQEPAIAKKPYHESSAIEGPRFDTLAKRLDALEAKVNSIDETVDEAVENIDNLHEEIEGLSNTVGEIEEIVDTVAEQVDEICDVEDEPIVTKGSDKMSKMFKMILLMNLLNGKK